MKYDFEKAKKYIEDNQTKLNSVAMGMREDWFWTAETVWENGVYETELNEKTVIGVITGSNWATPTMLIEEKDGTEYFVDCYIEDGRSGKAPENLLGCMSSECQDIVNEIPVIKQVKAMKGE